MNPPAWDLVVAPPARRDLLRLPEKAAAAVLETFEAIATNPRRMGKPLQFELRGRWSARRGPYRVIYAIDTSGEGSSCSPSGTARTSIARGDRHARRGEGDGSRS